MGFFSDLFSRGGRVARGQASKAMDNVEDATFEATVRQTVRDMRTELAKTINASAMAMSNHNRLEAEYQKFVRQSEEWFGRANQALVQALADLLRVKRSQLELIGGATARDKRFLVRGVTKAVLEERLAELLGG